MAVLKKILWGTAMLFLCFKADAQQDSQFSMGFLNRVFTNPGETGNTLDDMYRVSMANRLELTGFEGAPVINVLSFHGPVTLFGVSSGVGVTLYNDMAGALRAPGFNLSYAYLHPLGEGTLGAGINLGMISSWYAGDSWRLPDAGQNDPALPTREEAGLSFDMDLGVAYNSNTWFGGLSMRHLTAPRLGTERLAKLKQTLYLNAGYKYAFEDSEWELMPVFNLATDFAQTSWQVNATVWYNKKYWAGIGYRWGQAVVGMVGMDFFGGVKVAYAYEYMTSMLSKFSGGSHELMLSYAFTFSVPRGTQQYKSIRYL
jgi:type IX secretion system PorP/SprF family membrane protein